MPDLKDIKIKLIKKNALVNIKVGAGTVEKLVDALTYFKKQITDEQYENYLKELEDYRSIGKKEKMFSEAWMSPFTTLSFLLLDIQIAAEKENQTVDITFDNYIKTLAGINIIENDNLQERLSPEQPE